MLYKGLLLVGFLCAVEIVLPSSSAGKAPSPTPHTTNITALHENVKKSTSDIENIKKELTKVKNELMSDIHSLQERITRAEQKLQLSPPLPAVKK